MVPLDTSLTNQNYFWRWWLVAQGAVRAQLIIFSPPSFDQHLRLLQSGKDLPLQELIPHLPVERLNISILPGAAPFNEQGFHSQPVEPFPDYFGGEFRSIIRANVLRNTPEDKEIKELIDHILGFDLALHLDAHTLPGILIDDIQYLEGFPISRVLDHEVIALDMVLMLRP